MTALYFAGGIEVFQVGDIFFSFLPATKIEHQAIGLQELAVGLVGFYLEHQKTFVTKYKHTPSRTILHCLEMEMAPMGHIKSKFNCPIIARVLPANIFVN